MMTSTPSAMMPAARMRRSTPRSMRCAPMRPPPLMPVPQRIVLPTFEPALLLLLRHGEVELDEDGALADLLLDHGADPNAVASLRKGIRFVSDETVHEYRNVTPLQYARRFHHHRWVNADVMQRIERAGGR